MVQTYLNVPAWVNLKEKDSPVSIAAERNSPSALTTVCGSPSLLCQVTVVPDATVIVLGPKLKFLIVTSLFSGVALAQAKASVLRQRAAAMVLAFMAMSSNGCL